MYKIIFDGQLVEGFALGQVKKNLAKLFKLSDERVAAIFAGQPVVLKRDADAETAKKYKVVLHKAGAVTHIRPMASESGAAKPANQARQAQVPPAKALSNPQQAQPAPAADPAPGGNSAAGDWSLSATDGEPLLRAEERTEFVEREIDLGHISLVSAFMSDDFDTPGDSPPPAAVDTSHISVAEVGATIGDKSNAAAPAAVAELDASIAEVGATIGDGSSRPIPVAVADLDASIAPVGADLADAKPEPEIPDIDISHLKLD